ncbi:S8 family serine peptidase [Melittangium boletus]|uniref:S8 family serine peptidase n=1 Tax=Melittangium boletus TaxID=83453 RepID=UPI003DA408C6
MKTSTNRARAMCAGGGRVRALGTLGLLAVLSCGRPSGGAPTVATREGFRPGLALHKVQLSAERAAALDRGGVAVRTVADYGAFRLVEVDDTALAALPEGEGVEPRDESNDVRLNAGVIDTASEQGRALQGMKAAGSGARMHLVQFVGPIRPEWHAGLEATGVRVVAYIPHNAYLVYGDGAALARLQAHVAQTSAIQWNGDYLADYTLDPSLNTVSTDTYSVQLVEDAAVNAETLGLVRRHQSREAVVQRALGYVNVVVAADRRLLSELASRPDVVSIQPHVSPRKLDERQALIAAGQLSGAGPGAAGYLTWLAGRGFTQAQFDASGFGVDLSDSGVDNGTVLPNHFGLYTDGNVSSSTSRLVYSRLEGTANSGSTLQGCDGHGALNAHIIGGNATRSGTAFRDGAGYFHGLGVAPFVRMGSSVVFDPETFTSPNYENLQARAYANGMRISVGAWGSSTNTYTADAQRYDALVRDAQPAGSASPTTGNQEMVIVFPVGNSGSVAGSVTSPGSAKNVITVGASESVRPFGSPDGCNLTDAEADSAFDLAAFSSRGPTSDGRRKPDLVAPGTHVLGGVPQSDAQRGNNPPNALGQANGCFTGVGICGGTSGSSFFPSGQSWFLSSSGTSHAAPVVAGGAALVRQYFINQGKAPPSPAMTKAFLMNSARYLTGAGAADSLYSNSQGMGLVDLGRSFDASPRLVSDQDAGFLFTASGQSRNVSTSVADSSKPVRVTLAWTDAPGSTTGGAWNNNLDLTVVHNGVTYKGNVFSGANSVSGGTADAVNNVESVFLPAGLSGAFTVTVTATNINSNGVPNNSTSLDQDYALVIYNASSACTPGAAPTGLTASAVGNNRIDLGWNTNGATLYSVYRATTAGGPYTQVATVSAGSYSDTGLPAGVRHYYAVSSTTCAEGTRSAEVSAVPGGSCGARPSFAGASGATSGVASTCTNTLTWAAATPACGGTLSYSVYQSTTPGFTPSAANRIATGVGATSFSDDANLTNGTAYHYVVRASEASSVTLEDLNTVQRTVTASGAGGGSLSFFDDFDANRPPSASSYWVPTTAQGSGNALNIVSGCRYQSATRAYRFGPDTTTCGGSYPVSHEALLVLGGNGAGGINGFTLPTGGAAAELSFSLAYALESGYDGAYLAYSTAGAQGPFTLISDTVSSSAPYISLGGYDGVITGTSVRAWSGQQLGSNGALKTVKANLSALAGRTVWFAFGFFSDSTQVLEGAYVDDVRLTAGTASSCSTRSVPAGTAVTFRVSGLGTAVSPNVAIPLTVTALDASGNTATSYTGSAAFTSSDAQAVLPSPRAFSSGVASVSVTFKTAGVQSLTVTDTARPGLSGGASTTVVSNPATRLVFTVQPATTAAGQPISPAVKVGLLDASGNPVTAGNPSITLAVASNPSGGTLSGTTTVSAVDGVATFSNLSIDKVGAGYTLAASASGLTGATSASFQIVAGAPARLVFSTPPADGLAGEALSPAVRVALLDQNGNPATGTAVVTLALGSNPSGGTLTGTRSVTASGGVATFSDLVIEKAGAGYTLTATSGSLTAATSGAFAIAAAAPARLVFTQQPTSTTVGAGITPAVRVALQDAYGNPATTTSRSVTLALANNPSGATLGGTPTVDTVSGEATFNTLSVDRAGTGYTLSATSAGLSSAVSTAFSVGASSATQLAFTTSPPASVGAGVAFTVKVEVRDSTGAPVTGTSAQVVLSLVNAAGATLGGTTVVSTTAGVATFSTLTVDKVGTGYALQAAVSGLPSKTSSSFNVEPGPVASLGFLSQPGTTAAGATLTPPVRVAFLDALGNTVTTTSGSITLALGTNPSGASLGGTRTVAAVNGVATFSTLTVDKVGTGYTLRATSGSVSGTSQGFDVTAGAATRLAFRTAPANAVAGAVLPSLDVDVLDASGNRVAGATAPVTLSLGGGSGGTLSGTSTVSAVNGVATFSTLSIDKAGSGYTLTARSPGLTEATSASFTISPGAVAGLGFVVQPSGVGVDAPISPAVKVGYVDALGNPVASASGTLSVALGNNPGGAALGGTLAAATVNGVATFANLSLNRVGTGYTLVASASGASSVTSTAFDVLSLGGATRLAFQPGPTSTSAGPLGTVAVEFQDAEGRRVSDARAVRLSLQGGSGGTLTGTSTVSASSGLATFGDLAITRVATGYRLLAHVDGLPDVLSASFDISPGAVAALAFTTPPGTTVAGTAISPAIQVALQDAYGNRVTRPEQSVTLVLGNNPRGATLQGTTTVTTSGGVATFPGLSLDRAAAGYTLIARVAGAAEATSSAFEIVAGPASALAFSVPPGEIIAGSLFFPAVKVAVVDVYGNTVTSAASRITVSLGNNPGGGVLRGTAVVTAVEGVATFGNLGIDRPGSGYTLVARADPSFTVSSPAFNVLTADGAARLVFVASPTRATAGAPLGRVQVELRDASGVLINDSTREVTVALGENPRGDVLQGRTSAMLVNGVATFDTLSLRKAANGYTLVASTAGAPAGTSPVFAVLAGAAARFELTLPESVSAGRETTLSALAYDAYGNMAPSYSGQARVTSSDARAVFPATAAFTDGSLKGLKVTFLSGGQTTLTLTDGDLTGTASIRVDTFAAPTVALSEPLGGAVSGAVTIIARGAVASGTTVAKLAILVDGKEIAQGTESMLSTVWDSTSASEGEHVLTAVITDGTGNTVTSAPVTVTTRSGGCGCGATSGSDAGLLLGLFALARFVSGRRRSVREA